MNTRRWIMLGLGIAAVLLVVGRALAGVYSDYLWYDALGAGALWRLRMGSVLTMNVGSSLCAGLFAFCNLYAVRQSVVQLVFPRRVGNLEISEEVSGRYLMGAAILLSAVLGILLAIPHDDWMALVAARAGRLFGTLDPYIGADLGFFVYWLPLENTLWTWAVVCVIVVSLAVILLYALTPEPQVAARLDLRIDVRAPALHDSRRRHAAHARVELSPRHVFVAHTGQRHRRDV
jgi:uncharacterized membrane protein (UPF0182 family)